MFFHNLINNFLNKHIFINLINKIKLIIFKFLMLKVYYYFYSSSYRSHLSSTTSTLLVF